MLTKTKLCKSIEDRPEDFTLDELMDRLILLEKVEKGRSQSNSEDVISEVDLDKEIKKWFI